MAAALVVVAWGCVEPVGRPSASLQIEPTAVCLGDDFATVVALDATGSSPQLSLVPTPPGADEEPLEFAWHLSGDDYDVVAGGLDEARIEVTMAGERPLGVRLTVRNADGAEFALQRSVAVTLDCPESP